MIAIAIPGPKDNSISPKILLNKCFFSGTHPYLITEIQGIIL